METHFSCNVGDSVRVAVYQSESSVNEKQFDEAIDDVQEIQITSSVLPDIQVSHALMKFVYMMSVIFISLYFVCDFVAGVIY